MGFKPSTNKPPSIPKIFSKIFRGPSWPSVQDEDGACHLSRVSRAADLTASLDNVLFSPRPQFRRTI